MRLAEWVLSVLGAVLYATGGGVSRKYEPVGCSKPEMYRGREERGEKRERERGEEGEEKRNEKSRKAEKMNKRQKDSGEEERRGGCGGCCDVNRDVWG